MISGFDSGFLICNQKSITADHFKVEYILENLTIEDVASEKTIDQLAQHLELVNNFNAIRITIIFSALVSILNLTVICHFHHHLLMIFDHKM